MPITLVLPGVLSLTSEALDACSGWRSVAAFSAAPVVERDGIEIAVLRALALPSAVAPAPLAAFGAGLPSVSDYVQYADPVAMTMREGGMIGARVDDLDRNETATLLAMLNAHFALDDLAFHATPAANWLVRTRRAPDLVTGPLAASRERPLIPHLPRGPDAPMWRRWQSEIQMLLHEHPVNLAREAGGRAKVDSIWFWGGGKLAELQVAPIDAWAPATRTGELAHGISLASGGAATGLPARLDAAIVGADRKRLIVADDVDAGSAAASIDARYVTPLVNALLRGRFARLAIVANDDGSAATWILERPSVLRRLRARITASHLVVPPLNLA